MKRNERNQSLKKWRRGWLKYSIAIVFLKLMNYKKNSDDWHASLSIPLNLPKALLRLRDNVPVGWSLVQKHEVGALIARPESFEPVLSG